MKKYELPELPYKYNELEPYISEEQLKIHHTKHHKSYVDNANSILDELQKARKDKKGIDFATKTKSLAFNVSGHLMHSWFWKCLVGKDKSVKEPVGKLEDAIKKQFESFKRFKQEFTKVALTIEGSGWVALMYCPKTEILVISQIEKHNINIYPEFKILLVLDMWEHAFYIDHKNEKTKFVEGFWEIINWAKISNRFEKIA